MDVDGELLSVVIGKGVTHHISVRNNCHSRENNAQGEIAADSRVTQDLSFISRCQSKEEFMGTGNGRVLDLDHPGAECLFVSRCRRDHAIFVAKTLEVDGEPGVIRRDSYVGVTVADRISDSIHANVDFVAVQVIQFAVELAHLGIEGFARDEVEGIGVSRREFARQKVEILVPLLLGQIEGFGGSGRVPDVACAV